MLEYSSFTTLHYIYNRHTVQWLGYVWLFVTPWTAGCQSSLSLTTSQSLLKLMSIKSVMRSNHLILCHPLLLLPSIFHSIRVFSNESVLHVKWLKYWSINISPSNAYLGLISFWIDWLGLLQSKGLSRIFSNTTIQNPLILWCSTFFMVQLLHPTWLQEKTELWQDGPLLAK